MDCPICGHHVGQGQAWVRVFIHRRRNRRTSYWSTAREAVCAECGRSTRGGDWSGLLEYSPPVGELGEPKPCSVCGRLIRLPDDQRRTVHVCSDVCRRRFYAEQAASELTVTGRCEVCPAEIAGRSDQRFCSSACRQKAYRARAAG